MAWIDGMSQGTKLGRSIILAAEHASRDDFPERKPRFPMPKRIYTVPRGIPRGLLNSTVSRIFNEFYYYQHQPVTTIQSWWSYFYPLDMVMDWCRLYGPKGFYQYQSIFPEDVADQAIRVIVKTIHTFSHPTFLGVLKRMGDESGGWLSFPTKGLTLALDIPNLGESTMRLFNRLYDITTDWGGRIYLAKDALLQPHQFRVMYPNWKRSKELRTQIDPDMRLRSQLSARLGLDE
ncbi:hypothetical protein BFX06_09860 [Sulfobacillus thermosulfidooxidans]|nr:hypothetical protein BFX05_07905 [Sulfobacillus thermosulfidooxidans]OLZ13466.1 hypothetical protein BFX06_09860 [Sulfobacillus thermosulfidooxidans]OLZ21713.1 hypothetical protein BFX07_12910 [Sulfobacillus thermosulfidooxidans]